MNKPNKITSLVQFYNLLNTEERIIVDLLRHFIIEIAKNNIKEKISYNVPFFYQKKSICLIWPATIPRGGIKQGVLLGFWYGNRLQDVHQYLDKGTNKQIFYKIYQSVDDIDFDALAIVIEEALMFDKSWK